jgi:hypothetical protein
MNSRRMRCWNGYRLLSRHNRLDGTFSLFLLLHSFHSQRLLFLYCSLVSPVISCFLLSSTGKFMWKYGEVHISVLGSAPIRTGKFTSCVRGSSSQITVFRSPILYKRTGKFTENGFKPSWATVRGSSRTIPRVGVQGSSPQGRSAR